MILPLIIIILVLVCAYFEYQKKIDYNNKIVVVIICILTFVVAFSFIKKYNIDECEENFVTHNISPEPEVYLSNDDKDNVFKASLKINPKLGYTVKKLDNVDYSMNETDYVNEHQNNNKYYYENENENENENRMRIWMRIRILIIYQILIKLLVI